MTDKPLINRIAVRYCGGCNPRFDRLGFTARLGASFPDIEFTPFDPALACDAVLVNCGCLSQCARQDDLPADIPRFVFGDEKEFPNVSKFVGCVIAGTCDTEACDGCRALGCSHFAP